MSPLSRPFAHPRRLAAAVVAAGVALSGCSVVDEGGLTTSMSEFVGAPSSSAADESGGGGGASAEPAEPAEPNDSSSDPADPAPADPNAAPGGGAESGGEGPSSSNEAGPLGDIRAQLAALEVKGRAPKTGYDRDLFGQRWSDDVPLALGHNGCDTRNDILRRDLVDVVIKPNTNDCVALSGTLHDPFTGAVIPFQRGSGTSSAVQIDHVVAMSDAWQRVRRGSTRMRGGRSRTIR